MISDKFKICCRSPLKLNAVVFFLFTSSAASVLSPLGAVEFALVDFTLLVILRYEWLNNKNDQKVLIFLFVLWREASSVPVELNRPTVQRRFLARKFRSPLRQAQSKHVYGEVVWVKRFELTFQFAWRFIRKQQMVLCCDREFLNTGLAIHTSYIIKCIWCKPVVTQPSKAKYLLTVTHATRIHEQGKI